jgi:hypothetical protein
LLDSASELLYFSSAFGLLLFWPGQRFKSHFKKFQTRHLLADRFQLSAVTAGFPKQFNRFPLDFEGRYSEFGESAWAYLGLA